MREEFILKVIYGFSHITCNQCSAWRLEQVVEDDIRYTAKVFYDKSDPIIEVWTVSLFPKLVAAYTYSIGKNT